MILPIAPLPKQTTIGRRRRKPLKARKTAGDRRSLRPLLENLEARQLLATVTWDGGGGNLLWSNPQNWSGDTLPGATDDVTIVATGDVTIIQDRATTQIASLNLQEWLNVTGGTLDISGRLSVLAGKWIQASGPGSRIAALGATTIDAAGVYATNGGKVELPGVTSASNASYAYNDMTWQASGAGSLVRLPNLASVQNGVHFRNDVYVSALQGGRVELPALTSMVDPAAGDQNSRSMRVRSDGVGSFVDLGALRDFYDSNGGETGDDGWPSYEFHAEYSRIEATASGAVKLGSLVNVQGTFFALDPTTTIDLGTVRVLTTSRVDAAAMPVGLGSVVTGDGTGFNLTNVALDLHSLQQSDSASFTVSGGMALDLPALRRANYASFSVTAGTATFPALTLVDGARFYASGGVAITLPGVTSASNASYAYNDMTWQASGAGSLVRLPNLASVQNGVHFRNDVYVSALQGGRVELPALTSMVDPAAGDQNSRSMRVRSDGVGSFVDLGALRDFYDSNGGETGDDGWPSYEFHAEYSRIEATASGAVKLGSLVNVQGTFFALDPTTTIDLGTVRVLTTSRVDAAAMPVGLGSVVTGDGTGFNLTNVALDLHSLQQSDSASFTVSGGMALDLPALRRANYASFSVTAGTATFPALTLVDGARFYASGGVAITLPGVTSASNASYAYNDMTWQASGAGSLVRLPNLASVQNGVHFRNDVYVSALQGGRVELPALTSMVDPAAGDQNSRSMRVRSDGVGSFVDLGALRDFYDYNGGETGDDAWPSYEFHAEYSRIEATNLGIIAIGSASASSVFQGVYAIRTTGGEILFHGGTVDGSDQGTGGRLISSGNNRWDLGTFVTEGTIGTAGSAVWDFDGSIVLNGSGKLDLPLTGSMNLSGSLTGNTVHTGSRALGKITLDGAGTSSNPQQIEVMGRDLGELPAAYTDNFVIHELVLAGGTYIQLIDAANNAPGEGGEALYVDSLIVPVAATLDLNGLKLYTRASVILGSIRNGEVVQRLDSGALPVNQATPGGVGLVGETDEWSFFARAGRSMTIVVNPGSGNPPASVAPFLGYADVTLIDAQGAVLATGKGTVDGQLIALTNVRIPADGVYRVKVKAAAEQATRVGNYLVTAWDSTADLASIQLNLSYVGQIESPYSVDSWSFSAEANQQLRFDLINTTNPGIAFTLTGPNNWTGFTDLKADSPLTTLPTTGAYTLTARGTGGVVGGDYRFQLNQTTQTLLGLGQTFTGTLAGSGHAQIFRVPVIDAAPMIIHLDDLSGASNHNEIYAKFGAPPTRADFDARFGNPSAPDQTVLVDRAAPGDWYILVYGDDVPASSTYTLRAATSSVLLDSTMPNHHGRSVNAVITLAGAGFVPGSTVSLIGSSTYLAATTEVDSLTRITATFAASTVPAGVYTVRVTHPNGSVAELPSAFTFTNGTAAELRTNLVLPSSLRFRGTGEIIVEYQNVGDVAMPASLLRLDATYKGSAGSRMTLDGSLLTQGFWTTAQPEGFDQSVQFLAQGQTPGVLQPGETARTTVYWAGWDFVGTGRAPFDFQLYITDATSTAPIDWSGIKDAMRPPTINPTAWDSVYANLITQTGPTWGDYVKMLGDNAAYLGRLGRSVKDVNELLSFEVQQAIGFNPVPTLATSTDAVVLAPGLDITFDRTYLTSITQRTVVGPLGRGWVWVSRWDETSSVRSDGSIVIRSIDGGQRIFQPDSRVAGRYFSETDDYATLSNVQGRALVLEESDGTRLTFDVSGRLASVADPNGNRIDATTILGRVTRLTHSTGQWLQIDYNEAGRIVRLLDADARETLFTYDATNELLLSVRNFDGRVTSYTYAHGLGQAVEHAITSIEPPTGVKTFFTYDSHGRFATIAKANNVDLTIFRYDTAGTVSLTTPPSEGSPGGTRRLFFDQDGRLARDQNALGFSTYRQYDLLGNLARVTDPDGRSTAYEYGREGLVTKTTDASGQSTSFAYNGPFDRMTSFTDALGRTSVYAYDTRGNLLSITDPAGNVERWSYDSRGNVATSINRRSQSIQFGYNVDGQLTSKRYFDNTLYTYVYDTRGNLTTTTDPTGTTSYDYETSTDRVLKITSPGGQFLSFTYCNCGRRMSMTDELGYTLNYNYDEAGNLGSLVDSNGVAQVRYAYDSAGLLIRKVLGNDVSTTYRYDAAGQILSLINLDPSHNVLSEFDYTYDARGLRTSMDTIEGLWKYTYDEIGQLTGWTDPASGKTSYVYDAVGNRVTETINGVVTAYTVNTLNQYTRVGTKQFQYDLDGNLTRETDGATITNYAYNPENRLASVARGAQSWTYTYDALGNRVTATEQGVTTRFVVDPAGYGNVVGEYQGKNQVARNVYGYKLIARQDTAEPIYYTFEAIGSTSEITGANGTVSAHYTYTPFGIPISVPSTSGNTFQFVGEYGIRTESNGLDWMRARSYFSAIGRFTSNDPKKLEAGHVNYYVYVSNGPTLFIDPSGLTSTTEECLKCSQTVEQVCGTFPSARYYNCLQDYVVNCGLGGGGGCGPGAPGGDAPGGPGSPGGGGSAGAEGARDPNQKLGPGGFGDAHYVAAGSTLAYRIDFENDETATAPAQRIDITDNLDALFDWSTLELTEVGFGDVRIAIPAGSQFFRTTVPLTFSGVSFQVEIEIGLRPGTGTLYAQMLAIDPVTGLPPTGNVGILAPEDGTGRGQGYFTYTVKHDAGLTSGTAIRNIAAIQFDRGEIIDTNQIDPHDPSKGTNPDLEAMITIDAGAPSSSVEGLPAQASSLSFPVSWTGIDDVGGSGVASYDVFVSTDGGAFQPFATRTAETSAMFTGVAGRRYAFYSVATDAVGHRQPTPAGAQAGTSLNFVATATSVQSSRSPANLGESVTFTATVSAATGSTKPTGSVQFAIDGAPFGAAVSVVNGVAVSSATSVLAIGAHIVTATFTSADAKFANSAGTLSGGQAVQSVPALRAASPAVASSVANPTYGQAMRFTATVSPASGTGVPTGVVQFVVDGVVFGSAVPLVNGVAASVSMSSLGAGAHTVAVAYSGDGGFAPGFSTVLVINVAKAPLIVTAADATIPRGGSIPAFTASYVGFVNGDTLASLTARPSLSTSASSSAPGVYAIVVEGASSPNYAVTHRSGALTVQPAAAAILTGVKVDSVKVGKKKVQVVAVTFSDALDPQAAQSLANYRMVTSGKDKRFGTKDDKVVAWKSATYDAASKRVTLTTKLPLNLAQSNQLKILSTGLKDVFGQSIDGDRDGRSGGDATAMLSKKLVTVSSAAIDHLALAGAFPVQTLKKRRG